MTENSGIPARRIVRLSGTELSILSFVEEFGPIGINDVAYYESSRNVVEKTLNKLETMGYLKKDESGSYRQK
jgi:ribosomal protein S19E (S16A)